MVGAQHIDAGLPRLSGRGVVRRPGQGVRAGKSHRRGVMAGLAGGGGEPVVVQLGGLALLAAVCALLGLLGLLGQHLRGLVVSRRRARGSSRPCPPGSGAR
ncbi:hypothetical protein ABZT47_38385 [Sphaerisporangium sp. NPDC005289]|uniref:hypothetical protein n=1 Tax=Sphaerisporangium sp. NPDC005289 TaxID=3155247 RepID=UPI0033B1EEC2